LLYICVNGYYKCNKKNDFYIKYDILSKNYNFTNNKILDNYLDGLALSHLILYFILAYIYPSEWIFLIIIGILWELIEYILSVKYLNYECPLDGDNEKYNTWWYSQYEDVIMNMLGIASAFLLLKLQKSIIKL
jgi:hypothetical protein